MLSAGSGNFVEHFRRGPDGQIADTQYQLVSREDAYSGRYDQPPQDQNQYGYYQGNGYYQGI